jgi:hypothetical protein
MSAPFCRERGVSDPLAIRVVELLCASRPSIDPETRMRDTHEPAARFLARPTAPPASEL